MAGLDHAVKLRRGIGQGQVVDAEELSRRLAEFDADGDGSLTREELKQFFIKNRCGGPWFCATLANTMFAQGELVWASEVEVISATILGRVINDAMSRPARPTKRYVLTPDAVHGIAPKVDLKGNSVEGSEAPTQVAAKTSAPPARPPGPRAGTPRNAPRGRPRQVTRPSRPSGKRPGPRGPRRK